MFKKLSVIASVLLMIGVGVDAYAAPASSSTAPAIKTPANSAWLGKTPALKIKLVNGKAFDLASLKGQWAVVNFWATWCSPCLKEMPDFDALDQRRKDVSVLGLAFEEIELPDMQQFLKEHPVKYPIAIVDTFNPPRDFEVPRGLPTTYLLNPKGKVVERFMGPITGKQIEQAITKHRAGQ